MEKKEETKYAFASAIKSLVKKRSLDKITVIDIVRESGMTRQTFYRHFCDKYDLVNWCFEKLVLQSFRQMASGSSLEEALHLKFTFIKRELDFFKEAFRLDDYNSLVNYDFQCIYEFYQTNIKNRGLTYTEDIDFLLRMYCRGSIAMTVEWVLKDQPVSKEHIVTLLIEAIPEKLKEYLL